MEPCRGWGFLFLILLFYAVNTCALCFRISGPLCVPPEVLLLVSSSCPQGHSPSKAQPRLPVLAVPSHGVVLQCTRDSSKPSPTAQLDSHIDTGLAAQTPGWSQCHKRSLPEQTLNLCLAEHISSPLLQRWVPSYHPSLLGSIPQGFRGSPHPAQRILPVLPSPPTPHSQA